MMFKDVAKIVNTANGRNVVIFLALSMAVYCVMLFITIPGVESYAPGMKIFDLLPGGYSYDYAIKLLSSLGDEGRNKYLHTQLPLDFIYPALFAISSFLLLAWTFSKRYPKSSKIFYFCLVPVVAGIFDYLENIQVMLMIMDFPDVSQAQVLMASIATISKSGLTAAYFLLLGFGFIRLWAGTKSV